MFDLYANTYVTLRKQKGLTDSGKPIYEDKQIAARLSYSRKRVINAKGEEAISECDVITSYPVKVGDAIIIDGRTCPVIACSPQIGLGGKVMHYEAAT